MTSHSRICCLHSQLSKAEWYSFVWNNCFHIHSAWGIGRITITHSPWIGSVPLSTVYSNLWCSSVTEGVWWSMDSISMSRVYKIIRMKVSLTLACHYSGAWAFNPLQYNIHVPNTPPQSLSQSGRQFYMPCTKHASQSFSQSGKQARYIWGLGILGVYGR